MSNAATEAELKGYKKAGTTLASGTGNGISACFDAPRNYQPAG